MAAVGFAALSVILIVLGELVTHGPLLDGFRSWDQSVSAWFSTRRTSGWSSFSSLGSHLAETAPIIVGALILEAVLIWRRRWRDLLLVLVGLSVEITVFLTVNEIVRRPRPPVHRLGIEPSTFSFPSGHVAATVVLYGSIALLVSLHLPQAPAHRRRLVASSLCSPSRSGSPASIGACTTSPTWWPEPSWAWPAWPWPPLPPEPPRSRPPDPTDPTRRKFGATTSQPASPSLTPRPPPSAVTP